MEAVPFSSAIVTISTYIFKKNVTIYPCKDYDEDGIINDFSKVIEATKDLKVVLTYPAGVDRDFTKVLALKPEGYILKTVGKEKLLEQLSNFFETRKAKTF